MIPVSSWATYDASNLREPEITMTPTSGPPGTKVTITVSNFPDTSNEAYPYPDFYVYLPFADAIGTSNVPSACGKVMCFPIYTYEDAQRKNFADKTITFSLFSLSNPKPIYLDGLLHSVCDIVVNTKVQQSFGDLCNSKSQPPGEYEVKFAWVAKTQPDEPYVIKTMKFTVTEGAPPQEPTGLRLDQTLMDLYKEGVISEQTFDKELKGLGYNDEDIHKAKAVLGMLPHQQGPQTDQEEPIVQTPEEIQEKQTTQETENQQGEQLGNPSTTPKKGCLIATAAFGSEMAPQVQMLRETRDNVVMKTQSGAAFMTAFNSVYYTFAPTVADWEQQNPIFKGMVKTAITPLITTLSILNYVDIDSDAKMVSYGIAIILLNLGMYFVAPAFVLVKLSHKVRN
jgi:hypothetical protein